MKGTMPDGRPGDLMQGRPCYGDCPHCGQNIAMAVFTSAPESRLKIVWGVNDADVIRKVDGNPDMVAIRES